MPCEDCGSSDAELTECPFAADVNNEHIPTWLCDRCHYERAMDI